MFLSILIAWNLPILRDFIAGLKVNPLSSLSQTQLLNSFFSANPPIPKMQIPLAPYSRDPRTLPSRFWPHLRGSSRQYLYRSQRRGCDPYHGPHAADTEDTKASVCDADVCTSVLECVGGVDVGCGVFRVVGRWVLVCGEL